VLPEFAQLGTLPAAAGPWGRWHGRDQVGQMSLHIAGHRGTGAHEIKAPDQFIGDQLVIGWPLKGQKIHEELLHIGRPSPAVIASGGASAEISPLAQPDGSQLIETAHTDPQAPSRLARVQAAGVEILQDLANKLGRQTMSDLFFSCLRIGVGGAAPKPPELIACSRH